MPRGVYDHYKIRGRPSNALGKHWKVKDSSKMYKLPSGKENPFWKGGRPKCQECGKIVYYGNKRCIKHNINKGEKHYLWKKDRTKLKTDRRKEYDTRYKYWMLEVKKRDGWKCKINNNDCNGRLEAHHILNWIDYPELRYNINNGITLCRAHHPIKWVEEKRLVPIFQELVSASN